MFYLYLVILSLTQYFFFNSLNQLIFDQQSLNGDFVFSIFCVFFSFLIVIGALHVKHVNSEKLKKLGIALIFLGGIILLLSLFTLNFKNIFHAIELEIILSSIGFLIYYYQTVPEGVPDNNENVPELNSENHDINYFNNTDDFSNEVNEEVLEIYQFNYDDKIIKPELEELKELIISLTTIENIDEKLIEQLNIVLNLINQIDNANSEYRIEVIEDIKNFLKILLDQVINNSFNYNDQSIESFSLITKNLENIYYNTRGAQVFKTQKTLHELVEELINLKIQL